MVVEAVSQACCDLEHEDTKEEKRSDSQDQAGFRICGGLAANWEQIGGCGKMEGGALIG